MGDSRFRLWGEGEFWVQVQRQGAQLVWDARVWGVVWYKI